LFALHEGNIPLLCKREREKVKKNTILCKSLRLNDLQGA
jgi:hypothetical protein